MTECRKDAEVGGESRGEKNRALLTFPSCKLSLELVVHRARTRDKPRRTRASPPPVESLVRGLQHPGMCRESQVIVRGKGDDRIRAALEYPARARGVERLRPAPVARSEMSSRRRFTRVPRSDHSAPAVIREPRPRADQCFHHLTELGCGGRERRHQHDGVTEGTKQDSPARGSTTDRVRDPVLGFAAIEITTGKVDTGHQAESADICDCAVWCTCARACDRATPHLTRPVPARPTDR